MQNHAASSTCNSNSIALKVVSTTLSHTPIVDISTHSSSSRCPHRPVTRSRNIPFYGLESNRHLEHLVSVTRGGCSEMKNDHYNKGKSSRTYKCPVHNHPGCNRYRTKGNENVRNPSGTIMGDLDTDPHHETNNVLINSQPVFMPSRNDTIPRNRPTLADHSRYLEQRRYSCPIETVVCLETSDDEMLSKSIPKNIGKV